MHGFIRDKDENSDVQQFNKDNSVLRYNKNNNAFL